MRYTWRPILFADGRGGAATQVARLVEHPTVIVVATRKDGRSIFIEQFYTCAEDIPVIDILRRAGVTEHASLAAAIAAAEGGAS